MIIAAGVHSGPLEEGERIIQPLRELGESVLDLSGPVPYSGVQMAFDPLFLKGERLNYWKSLYLDSLDDQAIDLIIARGNDRPSPWSLIAVWHLDGAVNRVDPAKTALAERSAAYLFSLDTSWTDPADNDSAIAWTRDAWAEMKLYSRGAAPISTSRARARKARRCCALPTVTPTTIVLLRSKRSTTLQTFSDLTRTSCQPSNNHLLTTRFRTSSGGSRPHPDSMAVPDR